MNINQDDLVEGLNTLEGEELHEYILRIGVRLQDRPFDLTSEDTSLCFVSSCPPIGIYHALNIGCDGIARVCFWADTPSPFYKGLMVLLLGIYFARTPAEIVATPFKCIKDTRLNALSTQCTETVDKVLAYMKTVAEGYLSKNAKEGV